MVGSRVDGREFVYANWETLVNGSRENASSSRCVQALEEGEDFRVGGCCLIEACQEFHNDVGVTFDLALSIQLLRSREVVCLGVDEVTRLEIADSH